MTVTLHVPTPLRECCGGLLQLALAGTTVREVLELACERYPALQPRLFEGNRLRPFLNVYVNQEDIRFLEELNTPLRAGDQVLLLPAVAGG